jgi:geranylgeranyl pyrophosphate synthase
LYFAGRSEIEKARQQDLLPLFTATRGSVEWEAKLLPLLATWSLYLAGSHFFDEAQDKGTISLINAGIVALGTANIALSQLEVDEDTRLDMLEALGQVCVMGANAQSNEAADNTLTSYEDYLAKIAGKSAALIAMGFWLGGRYVGDSNDCLESLQNFGLALGMAMQLSDDCVDIEDDLYDGILTLPMMASLAMGNHPYHPILKQGIRDSKLNQTVATNTAILIESMGAMEKSRQLIHAYQIQATAFFDKFPYLKPHFTDYVATKN